MKKIVLGCLVALSALSFTAFAAQDGKGTENRQEKKAECCCKDCACKDCACRSDCSECAGCRKIEECAECRDCSHEGYCCDYDSGRHHRHHRGGCCGGGC